MHSTDPRDQFIRDLMAELAPRVAELIPPVPTERLITADQLASRLSLSTITISRYRKRGMPCVPVGRNFRYDLKACLEWMGRAG